MLFYWMLSFFVTVCLVTRQDAPYVCAQTRSQISVLIGSTGEFIAAVNKRWIKEREPEPESDDELVKTLKKPHFTE